MSVKTGIVVGSRGSRLAVIQAQAVAARLKAAHPQMDISLCQIVTRGDRDSHVPLDRMEDIGVFVKELETALREGRIDLAVHSLKDMPTVIPPELCLAAVTERADPRDVLVSRGDTLAGLPAGARIGTGSLRRAVQLTSYRPDLEVVGIRGNVDTRLRRVAAGEVDGVILAAAALSRLGWGARVSQYLPVDDFLPAVGQGALALETRCGDETVAGLVAAINDIPTWQGITAERAFLLALGGGCRAPIAALGTVIGNTLRLEGMAADPGGRQMLRDADEGSAKSAEALGRRLARKLLARGADKFIAEVKQG
ncbi:MAG: hydroxymethylbilane synthase [Chloroflexota bacterium]